MAKNNIILIPNTTHIIGGDHVFMIAEIGKNFIQSEDDRPISEYLENAKKLVRAAKNAGADAVKFQTHNVDDEQAKIEIVAPHFKQSDRYSWVKRNTDATPIEFWMEIKKLCDELGIIFFSTPMSRGAAIKLNEVGINLWKVGSGDMLDFVLLDYMAATGKPIILSSGMSDAQEVDAAVNFLKKRKAHFSLLHCVSKYPCPAHELRLKTIGFFQKQYNIPIGFSDHSLNNTSSIIAVSMGAKIIEKHFSFSRDLWGSDHKVSITPEELKKLSLSIRHLEKNPKLKEKIINTYLDNIAENEEKTLQQDEAAFRPAFRKTLVAGCNISAGEKITANMIYAMRPQIHLHGLPSQDYDKILGKITKRNINRYEPITTEDIRS